LKTIEIDDVRPNVDIKPAVGIKNGKKKRSYKKERDALAQLVGQIQSRFQAFKQTIDE
jgi:hypothetical protein